MEDVAKTRLVLAIVLQRQQQRYDAGWRGFDATLQLVTDETYVAVAVGRDGQDAAPQRGSFKGEEAGEPPRVNLQIMRQQ